MFPKLQKSQTQFLQRALTWHGGIYADAANFIQKYAGPIAGWSKIGEAQSYVVLCRISEMRQFIGG